jgi:carbon-monoxide dehydrogenase small subunit
MANYTISFTLNGQPAQVEVPTTVNLLTLLRDYVGVTEAKFGCEQGNCGACTVHVDGEAVNSCIVLGLTVDGRDVTTVSGIGTMDHLHPLQEAFTEHYGAQCGFCTPGMLMASKALLDRNPHPTRAEVVEAIVGNICRCTGYNKIIESILAAAEIMEQGEEIR